MQRRAVDPSIGVCASDVWLKRPPKTRHLFALSVIPGADNQKMTVRVRVRQVAADRR